MDVVLEWADDHILDKAWQSINPDWTRDNITRQCVSVSRIHVYCCLESCVFPSIWRVFFLSLSSCSSTHSPLSAYSSCTLEWPGEVITLCVSGKAQMSELSGVSFCIYTDRVSFLISSLSSDISKLLGRTWPNTVHIDNGILCQNLVLRIMANLSLITHFTANATINIHLCYIHVTTITLQTRNHRMIGVFILHPTQLQPKPYLNTNSR